MYKYLIAFLLISLGFICRLLPHPANFAPIAAIALFGGMYLPKKWSVLVPLVAMLISDIFLGFYNLPIMAAVYLGFTVTGVLGHFLRGKRAWRLTIGGAAIGSLIFFLLTNAAVWAFGSLYSHDLSGLLQSYYMGLPFFRNSLIGDVIYTVVLVGGYETAIAWANHRVKIKTI
ncbi:MAG: hypothetical protein PHD72_00930 [Patescibacteria group bacterium]|nr:hypothetical protein [Patescibacteria group bacterium]